MAQRRSDPASTAAPDRGARFFVPGPTPLWRWLAVAAALWVALALFYPGPMFRSEIFGTGDAANADAFRLVGDASLKDGDYPLWNPYLFAGMPTFGSLAYVRFLYPPSIILMPLQEQWGFAPLTWLLAHLLFGGLGMAWLLSRWRLPLVLLIFGGVAWMLLPKVVAWGAHGHGSKLGAAMYLPWIIGWAWRILEGGGPRAVGMIGLLLGLQLLRGHVQITYYTLLAVGFLSVWNGVWPLEAALRQRVAVRWRRCGLVVVGLALGFLVGALLLLPVHGYAGISIRGQDTAGGGGVGLDYATGWSLAPVELGTFVLPAVVGFGKATYMGLMPFNDYPNYFGILLLVLALAGWWRGERSLAVALGVMALLAMLVAFGRHGFGLYEWLYATLPFFNKFRIPSMILILVGFAAIVMAARGIDAWRDGAAAWGRPLVLPAVFGLLGLALLAGGGLDLARGGFESSLASLAVKSGRSAPPVLIDTAWTLHRASLVRIGLLLLVAAGALGYATRSEGFRRRGLAWVLMGLVVLDLAGVSRLVAYPERGLSTVVADGSGGGRLVPAPRLARPAPRHDTGTTPLAAELRAAVGHDRVWPLGPMGGASTWMADGVRSLGGYHPAKLASYEQIRRRLYGVEPAGRLANWLGATVVAFGQRFSDGDFAYLAGQGLDLEREPGGDRRTVFYRNRSALPRARLLTSWRLASSLPEKDALEPFLDAIQAGSLDVREVLTLDRRPDPAPTPAAGPLPAPEFVKDGLNEVVLSTDAPVPALLLLADMHAPGWRVVVDGREGELLVADLVLRAVALEAGPHEVSFQYRDPSVRLGLGISLAGLAAVLTLILFPDFRRRWAATSPGGDDE